MRLAYLDLEVFCRLFGLRKQSDGTHTLCALILCRRFRARAALQVESRESNGILRRLHEFLCPLRTFDALVYGVSAERGDDSEGEAARVRDEAIENLVSTTMLGIELGGTFML